MNTQLNMQTQFISYNKIGIIYDPMCLYAALLIEEYYSGKEYDGTIFLLTPCNGFDFEISRPLTRDFISSIFYNIDIKRIIFLNFEHLSYGDYANKLNAYLESINVDEIWEWQYENIISGKYTFNDKVKFMPMRYVSKYEKFKITEYKQQEYVCHFFGSIYSQRRVDLLQSFAYNYANFKIISGNFIYTRTNELSTSGFSLNIHSIENNLREQLRISENICLGIPVMTEFDNHPYYKGLVSEYSYNESINNVQYFFDNMRKSYDLCKAIDTPELYKAMTYDEYAYEDYKNRIISTY